MSEGVDGVIDLSRVRAILRECSDLVDKLDGLDLDERAAIEQGGKEARTVRAQQSQDLNLLSDRLELGAALTREQYWAARGHGTPTAPHSTDPDGVDRFQPVLVRGPANPDGDGSSLDGHH